MSAICLVDTSKIFLPSLHIKLGLMKDFVNALNKYISSFKHLQMLFAKINMAKLNEGIFVGPDLRKLIEDFQFI